MRVREQMFVREEGWETRLRPLWALQVFAISLVQGMQYVGLCWMYFKVLDIMYMRAQEGDLLQAWRSLRWEWSSYRL